MSKGDLDSDGRYPAPRCSDYFRYELSQASDACALLVNQTQTAIPSILRSDRCDCLGWNPIIVSEQCSLQQGDYYDIHEDIQWCFTKILAQGPVTPTGFPTISTITPTKPPLTTLETNTTIRHPIVYIIETTSEPAMGSNTEHVLIVCIIGFSFLLCALIGLLYMYSVKLSKRNEDELSDIVSSKNPTTRETEPINGETLPEKQTSVEVQKNTDQYLPPIEPSLYAKHSISDTAPNNEGSASDTRKTKRRKKKNKHKNKGGHPTRMNPMRVNSGHPARVNSGHPARVNSGHQLRINGVHSDNMVRSTRQKHRRTRNSKNDKASSSQTPPPSNELRLARGHSSPSERNSRKDRSKARTRASKNDTKDSTDGTSSNKELDNDMMVSVTFHRMDTPSDMSTSTVSASQSDFSKSSKNKPSNLTQTKRRRKAKKSRGDIGTLKLKGSSTPGAKTNKQEVQHTLKMTTRKTSRKVKKKRKRETKRSKKNSERTFGASNTPEPTTPPILRDEAALKALQYENRALQNELQNLKEASTIEASSGQGTLFQRKSTLTQLKEAVARIEKAKSIEATERNGVNTVHEKSAVRPHMVVVGMTHNPTLEHLKSKKSTKLALYE